MGVGAGGKRLRWGSAKVEVVVVVWWMVAAVGLVDGGSSSNTKKEYSEWNDFIQLVCTIFIAIL